MGKVVSRLNLFKACGPKSESEAKAEEKKEETKSSASKVTPDTRKSKHIDKHPVEISSSDVLLDDDMQGLTQIGFKNDDNYFSPQELVYYRKLYANEKVVHKPLTNIKYIC